MRCSAVLLAGGKSTRMGRDKALLEFDGEPLWRRQLETFVSLHPNSSWSPDRRARLAPSEVIDRWENAGPLAGIAAALRNCSRTFARRPGSRSADDDERVPCVAASRHAGAEGRGPARRRILRTARSDLSDGLVCSLAEASLESGGVFDAALCRRGRDAGLLDVRALQPEEMPPSRTGIHPKTCERLRETARSAPVVRYRGGRICAELYPTKSRSKSRSRSGSKATASRS